MCVSNEAVRSCTAFVFEKRLHVRTGLGETNLHRGYRLLLMANPVNKSLTMAGIPLCRTSPLLFEMTAEHETPVMHVYTQDSKRQCRSTLAFKSGRDRQDFYEVLQGISTDQGEQVVARVGLRTLTAETSVGQDTIAGAFQGLAWKDVRVVTEANAAVGQDQGDMTLSEHFRVVATHENGAVTDRLNLGKCVKPRKMTCADSTCRSWRALVASSSIQHTKFVAFARTARRSDCLARHCQSSTWTRGFEEICANSSNHANYTHLDFSIIGGAAYIPKSAHKIQCQV